MFKYDYFNQIFDISSLVEMGLFQKFEDKQIQRKYFNFIYPKESYKNLVIGTYILLWYLANLSYLSYQYGLINHVIFLVFIILIDFMLFLFVLLKKNNSLKILSNVKLVRFLMLYSFEISWVFWVLNNVQTNTTFEVMRVTHFITILSNLCYIFYLDNHFLLFSFIFLVNTCTYLIVQFKLFKQQNNNIYSEMILNAATLLICYSFKKRDIEINKELFCNQIKSSKIIDYFEKQMNDLNVNIINLDSESILYLNKNFMNFLYHKFKNNSEVINQYHELDNSIVNFKINQNISNKNDYFHDYEKFCNFFMSSCKLFQKSSDNNNYSLVVRNKHVELVVNTEENSIKNFNFYYEIVGDNLVDIIKNLLKNIPMKTKGKEDFRMSSSNYNRLGEFVLENDDPMYFDIYFRISLIKGKVLIDILIYDISELKAAEKTRAENKYKQRIFSKIAHEFKTPLTTIVAITDEITDILKEFNFQLSGNSHSKNQVINDINHIVNLSNYTIFLINDMIMYSSESNNNLFTLTKINLRDSLSFCFNILKTLIECDEFKKLSIKPVLTIEGNADTFTIISDEVALKQIILNYLSNSVKFTKTGKIKLIAKLVNGLLHIIVKDTGVGIKKEQENLIFNDKISFSKEVDYNSLRSCVGLGLCKKIANKLNIELKFNSEYGKFSEFFIIFNQEIESPKINCKTVLQNSSLDNIKENCRICFQTKISQGISDRNLIMIPISPIKIFRKSRTLNKNKFISRNSLNKELSIFNNCSNGLSLKEEIEEDEMKSALEEDRNIVVNERSIDTVYRKFTLKRYKSINESSSLETPIHISTFKNLDIECFSFNILSNLNFMNDNSRIIVIEDQNLIRNSTIKLIETVLRDLNRPNFDVIGGCDGIDLLYYVIKDNLNSKIKCIFTDENMVYLNGSEAVRIIRKLEEMGKINKCFIVSITAFVDDYTKNNILSAGCNKIVSKPCNKSTIMEIIKNYL